MRGQTRAVRGLTLIVITDDIVPVVRFELFELLQIIGEFDPGSGRTLAACLTHASRTGLGATPVQWQMGA